MDLMSIGVSVQIYLFLLLYPFELGTVKIFLQWYPIPAALYILGSRQRKIGYSKHLAGFSYLHQ